MLTLAAVHPSRVALVSPAANGFFVLVLEVLRCTLGMPATLECTMLMSTGTLMSISSIRETIQSVTTLLQI